MNRQMLPIAEVAQRFGYSHPRSFREFLRSLNQQMGHPILINNGKVDAIACDAYIPIFLRQRGGKFESGN